MRNRMTQPSESDDRYYKRRRNDEIAEQGAGVVQQF